jgi:hypothetical protein
VTDSSILCLTRGGESLEDIISGLKKIMKTLIPISPKKIGHYNGCKMDYPKITTKIKHNPNNMENQICIISTQIITFIEKYLLNSQ